MIWEEYREEYKCAQKGYATNFNKTINHKIHFNKGEMKQFYNPVLSKLYRVWIETCHSELRI